MALILQTLLQMLTCDYVYLLQVTDIGVSCLIIPFRISWLTVMDITMKRLTIVLAWNIVGWMNMLPHDMLVGYMRFFH